jgi:hypothetical protein
MPPRGPTVRQRVALRKSWNIQPIFKCPAGKGGALYAAFCTASRNEKCELREEDHIASKRGFGG